MKAWPRWRPRSPTICKLEASGGGQWRSSSLTLKTEIRRIRADGKSQSEGPRKESVGIPGQFKQESSFALPPLLFYSGPPVLERVVFTHSADSNAYPSRNTLTDVPRNNVPAV